MPNPIDYQRRGFIDKKDQKAINQLMTKSTSLLAVLIEGSDNKEIFSSLCDNIDVMFLKRKLTKEYSQYVQDVLQMPPNTPKDEVNHAILSQPDFKPLREAFNMYNLLATLADSSDSIYSDLFYTWNPPTEKDLPNEKQVIEFFWNYTKSIEIKFKNDKLIKVFFTPAPISRHLAKKLKDKFNKEVNRNSTSEKITVPPPKSIFISC